MRIWRITFVMMPDILVVRVHTSVMSRDDVLEVGDIRVTSLSDGRVVFDPRITFPETPLEHWEPYYDIFPEYFSGQFFLLNLGVFVMSSADKKIVADTGFGPHGQMLGADTPAELMDDFKRKGIGLDDIDTVFLTHLHGDHVGWNTRPDSVNIPTFPNASYRVHRADWEFFSSAEMMSGASGDTMRRSVLPLEGADVLDLMDGETELAPGVTAIHTPGHTPGHMSLLLSSGRERALLIGDVLGSPMHVTEPGLHYWPDHDKPRGIETRHGLLDMAESEDMIVLGSHLSPPGWGTLVRWEGRRYWRAFSAVE